MSAEQKKFNYPWVDAPAPKSTNKKQAEKLVSEGVVEDLDKIYTEQTPEQLEALEKARARWKKQGRYGPRITSYPWVDMPLFGRKQ